MIGVGTRVSTPEGDGVVLEYVRQMVTRGEYEERPAVLLDDGTLRAFPEADLTEQ